MSLFRKKSIQKGAIERIKKEEIDFSSMLMANSTNYEELVALEKTIYEKLES